MNKTLLTAVSAIAIMGATPALADTSTEADASYKPGSTEAAAQSSGSFSKDVEKAWENTKEDVSDAAENVSEAAKDTYYDAKHAMKDDDAKIEKISVSARATASGKIGQPVYNTDGERIAKVRDIILDEDGDATMVILGDGDFTGLGKLVAFDYNTITTRNAEGDVISSLDENMIDTAANFSYNRSEFSNDVRVMPTNGYSVAELLDGDLVNPEGQTLANVEDIVFRNSQADQVVVSFGQVLGLGGEKAAIAYGDADLNRNGDSVDFKLSANESQRFKQFKKTALN